MARNTPHTTAFVLSGGASLGAVQVGMLRALYEKLIVLPPPCPLNIQPIDFAHADRLIERGLSDARRFLEAGGEEQPAIHMHMHRHRGGLTAATAAAG